ncbi:MAG: Hcp family type VI secretion system effector [Pyrinomonadaceae bacterium]
MPSMIDAFLKIPEIPGESQDSTHPGEFDLQSFSLGVSQTGSMALGGGGGTGQAHFQDIPIMTFVGKSTPELFLRCATGKHFPKAEIIVRKAGDTPFEYLKIELEEVLISSYSMNPGSGGELAMENWSLDYAKISYSYNPQKKDGTGEGWITKWYNVKTNEKG